MATLELIGSSREFRALLENVEMVAAVDTAVLIQGETGTGKEVIARAIHEASPRRRNRFVAVNCAAIPSTLIESELFGYERGAFTGAVTQSIGRFQAADCGTLFLDEIGDLPLELQPKLLRVLQEKQFERLGGVHTQQVNVRVVAATNQDLALLVQEKKFRPDLYYRLNVFPIMLAPLRERLADIPLLAEHFVRKFAQQQGKTIDAIPEEVMEALERHDWPGNIRELQNVIERGVIITTGTELSRRTTERLAPTPAVSVRIHAAGEPVSVKTLAEAERAHTGEPVSVKTLAEAERAHITATLRKTNWVVGGPRGAAAQLGLPRTTLLARMQRLGISTGTWRNREERASRGVVRVMGDPASRLKGEPASEPRAMEAAAS